MVGITLGDPNVAQDRALGHRESSQKQPFRLAEDRMKGRANRLASVSKRERKDNYKIHDQLSNYLYRCQGLLSRLFDTS